MTDLTPHQEHSLEEAWKSLRLAAALTKNNRRARAQEVLREANDFIFKMPKEFTDEDFRQQYDQLYNQLYRGLPNA